VQELARHGVTFGSHTVSHPRLVELDRDRIYSELEQSKKRIEDELQQPVTSFSYPFAFPEEQRTFVEMLRELLLRAGYEQAVTTRIGFAGKEDDPLLLKRLPVNVHDDVRLLEAKLQGAYNWVHLLQKACKHMKSSSGPIS